MRLGTYRRGDVTRISLYGQGLDLTAIDAGDLRVVVSAGAVCATSVVTVVKGDQAYSRVQTIATVK